jgi:hypothetical protein
LEQSCLAHLSLLKAGTTMCPCGYAGRCVRISMIFLTFLASGKGRLATPSFQLSGSILHWIPGLAHERAKIWNLRGGGAELRLTVTTEDCSHIEVVHIPCGCTVKDLKAQVKFVFGLEGKAIRLSKLLDKCTHFEFLRNAIRRQDAILHVLFSATFPKTSTLTKDLVEF